MAIPRTIEEVIQQLELIINDCENKNKRQGYFASLYLRVTKEVRQKISEKYFDNNERMEQLDVVFANRYIIAYEQYQQNQPCTTSWRITFDACKKWRPLVMQHLLAGMNAHIGLDLGIAAATICPGDSIHTLQSDFNKINTILANMVDSVEQEISDIWPLLRTVDWFAGKLDEKIAVFGMDIARNEAWNVALQYAALQEKAQQEHFITLRDEQVPICGKKIVRPGVILNIFIGIFQLFERGTVKKKIEILSRKN